MSRILNAETARSAHAIKRKQQQEKREQQQNLKIRPGESLRKFGMRAEQELRPAITQAIREQPKTSGKTNKSTKKRKAHDETGNELLVDIPLVDQRIAAKKQKRWEKEQEQMQAGETPSTEGKDFLPVQRPKIFDVVQAPPNLSKFTKTYPSAKRQL